MKEVASGTPDQHESLLARSFLPEAALGRIFESEETGLFHLKLAGGGPLAIGHDRIVTLVLCLEGRLALTEAGEESILDSGSYALVEEGQACTLAACGSGAEALLFFGLEQLPGAFFNSYGPANV
jgi:hypothetical protein